jgi:predicted ArsR family transcriptional regulator
MGDLDAPGPVGAAHPETSRAVASLRFGSQRWRVLDVLADHSEGLTADAVGVSVGLSPNQAATRLGELRAGGWVQYLSDDTGSKVERLTSRGNRALVQGVTVAGLAALNKKS